MFDISPQVSSDYLRTTSEIDSRSLGGKVSGLDQMKLSELLKLSPSYNTTYQSILSKSAEKVRKVQSFILDMNQVIDNIFNVMKKDSYQIWTTGNRNVAGVEVPNGKIITELIQSKGGLLIKSLEREILNKRMAKRNKDTTLMNTEDILIFRKVG